MLLNLETGIVEDFANGLQFNFEIPQKTKTKVSNKEKK